MARNILSSVFGLRCPACRQGHMFLNKASYSISRSAAMPENCSVCGESFRREPGFFYGAMYVSYGVTVAIFIAIFLLMQLVYDPGVWEIVIAVTVVLFALGPWVFRLSRSIWAHMFIKRRQK